MTHDLALADISAVIRLVREVCDRWDDPRGWREHLLHGACALLEAKVGMMIADAGSAEERFVRPTVIALVGIPNPMRPLAHAAISHFEEQAYEDVSRNFLPGLTNLYGQMARQGWVTTARREMTDDDAYHAAPYYLNYRKPIDCDDYVVSVRIVDVPRRPEGITIDRPHGAPRFATREVAILKLLHDEIAPLVGTRLATEEHLCRDGLSKRLRETLSLLLEGQSEKQVAASLRLSPRTVHEYVAMLYEHFQVSSRAELLAYFIRRTPVPRQGIGSRR